MSTSKLFTVMVTTFSNHAAGHVVVVEAGVVVVANMFKKEMIAAAVLAP